MCRCEKNGGQVVQNTTGVDLDSRKRFGEFSVGITGKRIYSIVSLIDFNKVDSLSAVRHDRNFFIGFLYRFSVNPTDEYVTLPIGKAKSYMNLQRIICLPHGTAIAVAQEKPSAD